ncbi:TraR/DksA C4-type zinc finger protein [Paenibacillus typhae]|uniref:Transcriptional regulator, TraR/DksA family n=1 Tax=Paenibacillus typhae TaxID=1174501 RepID=A0A1G8UNS2_9BACL|nr:TraR/DksA C4-type zinc finger protein [Paenibacillus typhae]SDJ55526.1 transcriptional regulator, TraR/DksA family [Paenibacillus typhae]
MSHLTDQQLAALKNALEERRQELEQHFKDNDEENSLLGESLRVSTGELSTVDNHPADAGTETFERSRDLGINNALRDELEDIEAALQRMEEGTYGICVISKEEIPYERLEAIPYTPYAVEHVPGRESADERPVEEQVMTPPPSGAGQTRQEHSGRFDDADAWDSVEDYGSASSPVPLPGHDSDDQDS